MTIRDFADAPFGAEATWAGPVGKRKPRRVVIEDSEADPHHVDDTIKQEQGLSGYYD